MKTKYGIPQKDLDTVIERDRNCVYCHKTMISPWDSKNQSDSATIEHLNHRKDWDSVGDYKRQGKSIPEIIAICCFYCNRNRGDKKISDWFRSSYCQNNKINENTVADPVRKYIRNFEQSI